jgi:hypothetical protein
MPKKMCPMVSYFEKYDKQDQQGKVAFNELEVLFSQPVLNQ